MRGYKFNNTGARKQASFYHITLKLILLAIYAQKCHDFALRKRDAFYGRQSIMLRSNLHI